MLTFSVTLCLHKGTFLSVILYQKYVTEIITSEGFLGIDYFTVYTYIKLLCCASEMYNAICQLSQFKK